MWLYRLRKLNGPNFTWPLMTFAGLAPEEILQKLGKIHAGKPLATKTRRELIASLRPNYWKYLRADNGDLPEGWRNDGGVVPVPGSKHVPSSPGLRVVS